MFHSPYVLLLLLVLPILAWRMWAARQSVSLAFSSTDFASSIRPTFRQRMMWVPAALTLLTMAVLIVALAGPREGRQETIANTEGIAIEIVVDRSGSMRAMDFKKQDVPVDRLTAGKDVVGRFVLGEGDLEGRFSDLIGLVTFARNADGMTPPTLDHPFLVSQLNESSIVNRNSEDGTAIGDAIGLAVEKLAALDKNQKQEIESKVIILLTDGENNSGSLEPIQAAGTKGRAPVPVTNAIGRQIIRWMDVNIDEKTLQKIADTTNGKYFRATDTESLEEIYAEIDRLEKSKVEERQYVDYRELAVRPIHYGGLTFPPVALWAFLLLGLQMVLKNTFFREFG
jgi:Ca-activated chloride channel family protein